MVGKKEKKKEKRFPTSRQNSIMKERRDAKSDCRTLNDLLDGTICIPIRSAITEIQMVKVGPI